MTNYNESKIYKLISSETDQIYIGSTTYHYLSDRFGNHKYDYRRWLSGDSKYLSAFEILKYDDVKIILIESYSCNSKDELRAREQYWIEQNKDICVNLINAYGKDKEKIKNAQKKGYEKK